jgi:hypothetical protein
MVIGVATSVFSIYKGENSIGDDGMIWAMFTLFGFVSFACGIGLVLIRIVMIIWRLW